MHTEIEKLLKIVIAD